MCLPRVFDKERKQIFFIVSSITSTQLQGVHEELMVANYFIVWHHQTAHNTILY